MLIESNCGNKLAIILRRLIIMVSKIMSKLAKRFMLDVQSFWSMNTVGNRVKVYKFTGNNTSNFEALAEEAFKYGWVKSTEFGNGTLVKQ
jgi:L-rhamnose isomerase